MAGCSLRPASPPGAEPREDKVALGVPLSLSLDSPLSRAPAVSPKTKDTDRTLAPPPPSIAAAPRRHWPIAWSRRCASSSSTFSPNHASRDDVNRREFAVPFFDSGPTSLTIPASSSYLWSRRPPLRLRGENANRYTPLPLPIALGIVGMLVFSAVPVRRRQIGRAHV